MRPSVASSLLVLVALAAPASAQPQDPVAISSTKLAYDSLTFQTKSGSKTSTFAVSSDGSYTLATAGGKHLTGTLTPSQWFDIASAVNKAPLASENGESVGEPGKTTFQVEAKSGAQILSVSGNPAGDLGSLGSLVSSLEGAADETQGKGPGFQLFPPKMPAGLDVQLGPENAQTKVEVLDTGSVKIEANGKTYTGTLTAEEEREIAAARRRVDDAGSLGDVSLYSDPAKSEPFRIVVYETLHEFLLQGKVGNYGTHDDVGALVTALRSVVDRIEKAPSPAVAKPAADETESSGLISGLLDRVADSIAKWLVPDAAPVAPVAGPSRTAGLSSLLDARVDGAVDKARGDDASDR